MRHTAENGFTIYELMITVLIVGLVLALGLPNLSSVSQDNRVAVTVNELQNAFKIARSEAVRANANVTVCASNNSLAPDANCGGEWQDGFIVFVDVDGDLTRDNADETLLKTHPAIDDGVHLIVANDAGYFGFSKTGTGRGDVAGVTAVSHIVVCDERGLAETSRGKSAAQLFVATPLGLATATRDYNTVSGAMQQMDQSCSSPE